MRAPPFTAVGFALAAALAARTVVAAESASTPETGGPAAATTPTAGPASTASTASTAPATPAAPPVARKPLVAAAPTTAPAPLPPPSVAASQPHAGVLREPAPRPATDVRVQSRFAVKAKTAQLFAAGEYLSRGDFYNSPGMRVGAAYYVLESLGLEVQISHYWSSLNATAERVKRMFGELPDSRAPTWLMMAGARYSIGYGKLMIGGLGGAIHFEPQAFAHAGMHIHDGDAGPSVDAGLGFLVFLMPKLFVRIDAAIIYEREDRSGQSVGVWGTLPAFGVGGIL